jgi:hypothetical protein
MPQARESATTRSRLCPPALWPSAGESPRARAHRELPSITTATCRGSDSGRSPLRRRRASAAAAWSSAAAPTPAVSAAARSLHRPERTTTTGGGVDGGRMLVAHGECEKSIVVTVVTYESFDLRVVRTYTDCKFGVDGSVRRKL